LLVVIGYLWTTDHSFFNAKIDSEYVMHFDGKLKCAYVVGWYDGRKCMCLLTEHDKRLKDQTLIKTGDNACEGESNEISPN